MNQVSEHPSRETRGIIYNPHFWAIALIMVVLIIFYNANHFDIANWVPWLGRIFTAEFVHDLHRSLFLIPLLYAGAVFRLWGALLSWLVFLAAILPRALFFSPNPDSLMRAGIFALVALMASVLIAMERNRRQGEREASAQMQLAHRTYTSQILRAQEEERQRIAQELHDDTVQSLLVVANCSQSLACGDYGELVPEAKKQAEELRDMVLHMTEDVRRISHDLRPSILDNIGLVPALRWLTDQLTQEDNINTEVIVSGEERKLRPEAEVIIFRITQEAMNNVRRHSGATEVKLSIDFAPGSVKITVQDNGKGFHLPSKISDFAAEGRLGLNGMYERAKLLDATFDIQSKPGDGTVVTIEAGV